MINDVRGRAAITGPEVFPTEINVGICELMSIRWQNGAGRYHSVGRPRAVGVLCAFVTNPHLRMQWIGVVLSYPGRAVVIPTVGDVGAVNVFKFNLEAVTLHARVIHGVEIVDRAVSDAGLSSAAGECH